MLNIWNKERCRCVRGIKRTSIQGEYGIDGVACGVPCVIGRNGIEDIIELELNDKEKEQMAHTCSVIKEYCERAEKVQ